MLTLRLPALAALAFLVTTTAGAGIDLAVTATEPDMNALTAARDANVTVTFDRVVDMATVDGDSFRVFGRWSGAKTGSWTASPDGLSVTYDPDQDFSAGERVLVVLSHDLAADDGAPMRPAGYSWYFWVEARPATRAFTEVQTMTTRTTPTVSSRAYGGIGTDLNHDGYLDITVINEDTADLRVFLNLADGTGQYAPFIEPTFAVEDRASPNEPADFDNDGNVDICVANINADTVSILLGNGDGTFAAQQIVNVGGDPRGIAVLDCDGDGDLDIANTNSSSSNMSLLENDGSGVFGPAAFFEGGGVGEWSLDAADMNEDGILDLVIGARNSQVIAVQRGVGDGTFDLVGSSPIGGATWMITAGDVNADGHLDVSSVNSANNEGSILLGDGLGGVSAPQTYPTDPFCLATDLGDLDGDGDLDWVTSSFSGDWWVYVNDGTGAFTFDQELAAPDAASCALIMDVDNDGDTDLALIDELEDVVIVMTNEAASVPGDVDGDGQVDVSDLLAVLGAWGPCAGCPEDLDGDDVVDVTDLLLVLGSWT